MRASGNLLPTAHTCCLREADHSPGREAGEVVSPVLGSHASDVELEPGFLIPSHRKGPLDAFCGPMSGWPKAAVTPLAVSLSILSPIPLALVLGNSTKGVFLGPLPLVPLPLSSPASALGKTGPAPLPF